MADEHDRLIEILNQALVQPTADAREHYLAEACGQDRALRQQVDALLAAHRDAGDFLRHSVPVATESAVAGEGVGSTIGRYKLLEQIGEGGCGVVYMAEQKTPIHRRVALKVIKPGMDTKQVIARFDAERQALALMDHPNIANVLEAGATESARPYFVMELVRGTKITDFCDEQNLPTDERLRLFTQVCQAIQHAHQKGVIHRDIKPSNILVTVNDGVPVPKVIDFGIAKATQGRLTDQTVFTAFEQFIGTPAYMSPEQAVLTSLDIDTRSDIYSLGVLLYELLTGSTPFDQKDLLAAGMDEMRRTIREQEPPLPSTRLSAMPAAALTTTAKRRRTDAPKLIHLVRGDLDWIVMKCLEKDRSRRYETANGLAMDVRRHLENEPVSARPPSAAYRLQKAWRRHKTAFAVSALMASVLVAATGISARQAVRATRAETLAKQRLADSEAISKFLTDVFQSPDPARDGRTITVAETLGAAAKKLETDLANQPARRAKLQATLAETYYALGLYREAIPLQEKVRDYYLATFGAEHTNTLGAMDTLALSYYKAGRLNDALKLSERVLPLSRKVLGPEHPDTLTTMNNLAKSYYAVGRRDEALNLREQVLKLRRKVLGPEHPDTLAAMNGLANSYDAVGRRDEALNLREQVMKLRRKVLGPEHPDTLAAMGNLANSYEDAGRRDEALELDEQVLGLRRKVLGAEHPDTLNAMDNLANDYQDAGRRDEALNLQEQVLKLSRKVFGPEHPQTLRTMNNLAVSYDDAGRRDEALNLREQVLKLRRKVLGPEHPDTLAAMGNLAKSYYAVGRRDEALELRDQVLGLCRKVLGPEHPDTLSAMNDLAISYDAAGRRDEALEIQEQVLGLRRKVLGPEHPETLMTMNNLAVSYYAGRRQDEALNLREQVLKLRYKLLGPEHPDTLSAMYNLAISYDAVGRRDEALSLREQVVKLSRKVLGPEHHDTLEAMGDLAISYDAAGRRDEALNLREQVLKLTRKALGPEHPDTLKAMNGLASSYAEAGRRSEALKLWEEVLALRRKVLGPEHPDTLQSLNDIAWSLATSDAPEIRNGTNAVSLAERAVAATHRTNAGFLDTLAAAYAETQRFDKAVAVQQEAIGLLQSEQEKKDYGSRLKLYQANRPYRIQGTP